MNHKMSVKYQSKHLKTSYGRKFKNGLTLSVKPFSVGDPTGNRTPVFAVRGRRPRPLDYGAVLTTRLL